MKTLDRLIEALEEMIANPTEGDFESEGYYLAKDSLYYLKNIEKRTAKVIHKSDTYVVTPSKTTTTSYETITNLWEECGNCHAKGMYHGWNYCPMCGCKLEWE